MYSRYVAKAATKHARSDSRDVTVMMDLVWW